MHFHLDAFQNSPIKVLSFLLINLMQQRTSLACVLVRDAELGRRPWPSTEAPGARESNEAAVKALIMTWTTGLQSPSAWTSAL